MAMYVVMKKWTQYANRHYHNECKKAVSLLLSMLHLATSEKFFA